MKNNDEIEFYCSGKMVAGVKSSMAPLVGSLISIRKTTYRVIFITFAIDDADDFAQCRMRCNIDLEKVK